MVAPAGTVRERPGSVALQLSSLAAGSRCGIKPMARRAPPPHGLVRCGGAIPVAVIVGRINAVVAGWVTYFRVGNSSRAFSEVRDYLEMKIRTLLTRRKRRRKTSIGWWRWSN